MRRSSASSGFGVAALAVVAAASTDARAEATSCAGALAENGHGTIFVDVSEATCAVSTVEDRGQGEAGDVIISFIGGNWEPYVRGEGRFIKNILDPGAVVSLQACASQGSTRPSFPRSCRFHPRVAGTEDYHVVWTDAAGASYRLDMTLTMTRGGWVFEAARFCVGEDAC